jgi:hypothetical protein
MRRNLVTLPVLSVLAIFAAGCEDPYASAPAGSERGASPSPARRSSDDWQVYTSQEGRFSILLPALRETDDGDAATATGRVRANGVKAGLPSLTMFQVTSYHRSPISSSEKIASFLDSTCDMHDEGYGLLSRTTVSLGPCQGREITFKRIFGRCRIYGMDDREIVVTSYTPPGKEEGEEVRRFFDSFKVLEPRN